MKLIFAQGNPGLQYAKSRHNAGFMVLDNFASQYQASFKPAAKFAADIASLQLNGQKVLLVKPCTFYNETGPCARHLIDFYKLNPATDLLVIHDDLALPFGTIRVRQKGSDGGNNGIKSLNSHLGQAYWRLRLGIWNDSRELLADADFVLSNFSDTELKGLQNSTLPTARSLLEQFINDQLQITSQSA